MSKTTRSLLVIVGIAVTVPGICSAQDWKDSLKTKLTTAIVPAKTSSDRLRVTKPGSVLIVKKDGISASPGGDNSFLKNHLRDGQVEQAKGLAAMLANKKTNRDYRVDEKVYVTDVDINDNDVQLRLVSLETSPITVNSNTEQTRFKAILEFDFAKGSLKAMDFAQLKSTISSILQPEASANEPKALGIGQTIAEVESVLGKPETVLNLGAKTVYVYKSLKVTFVGGKVSDIQ